MRHNEPLSGIIEWLDQQHESWTLNVELRRSERNEENYCNLVLRDDNNHMTAVRRPAPRLRDAERVAADALMTLLRDERSSSPQEEFNSRPARRNALLRESGALHGIHLSPGHLYPSQPSPVSSHSHPVRSPLVHLSSIHRLPPFLHSAAEEKRVLLIHDAPRGIADELEMYLSSYVLVERVMWVPKLDAYAAVYSSPKEASLVKDNFRSYTNNKKKSKKFRHIHMSYLEVEPVRKMDATLTDHDALRRELDDELDEIVRRRQAAGCIDQ